MKLYGKIFALGHEENQDIFKDEDDIIVIEEKVDGANFRMEIKDGQLSFGSRTQTLDILHLNKNFKRAVEFLIGRYNPFKEDNPTNLHKVDNLIFYMENMVKHTIGYNWDITPPVIGYDIYDNVTNRFLALDTAKMLFDLLGIEFIPVVKVCSVKECKELMTNLEDLVPTSKYITMKAEGIVFKNYSKQIMAKFVRKEFKEKNEEVFGKTKKKASNDEEWMTAVYCNNFKIEKMILKLLDEDNKLSMELMHKLPNRVFEDIFEENWKEIVKLDKTINFKKFKGFVSKRCVEVLKQFMVNKLLESKK